MSEIHTKLARIQQDLRAPKDLRNDFGNYNYRSNESILQALKPLLAAHGCAIVQSDELVMNGDRWHIKATSTLIDVETGESVSASAYAREAVTKKGMDDSQLTGVASSYSRKYSLNGLFLIDDNKDADTNQYHTQVSKPATQQAAAPQQDHPDKARAMAIVREHADAIKADPALKDYVDACIADEFFTDLYNNLSTRFTNKGDAK